jgi:hypothetical protein
MYSQPLIKARVDLFAKRHLVKFCNRAEVGLVEISASAIRLNALQATKSDALKPDDKRILAT